MELLLLRHGMTPGNKLSRYIGKTDEPLSEEGRQNLQEKREGILSLGEPDLLFVSPLIRCAETAEILYPGRTGIAVEKLREFDFGIFENRNYLELNGNPEYQAWLDSMCEGPVPEGEDMASFKKRCCEGLEKVLVLTEENKRGAERIALVVHGGTIMSLMETYGEPKKGYYDWSVKNGKGFLTELDLDAWKQGKKILQLKKEL